MKTEPKTCCGTCHFVDGCWQLSGDVGDGLLRLLDIYCLTGSSNIFCPACGAHLLPNGEVVPRGEVVGEGYLYRTQTGYPFVESITMSAEVETGCVLLVRPVEDPADEGSDDNED